MGSSTNNESNLSQANVMMATRATSARTMADKVMMTHVGCRRSTVVFTNAPLSSLVTYKQVISSLSHDAGIFVRLTTAAETLNKCFSKKHMPPYGLC